MTTYKINHPLITKSLLTTVSISFLLCIMGCTADGQETLKSKEFNEKIKSAGTQLVDTRTAQEYENGYIEGAENIDFYSTEFVQLMSKFDKEKPLALYCKSGNRTKNAMKILSKEGFKKIYTLDGGLMAWEKDGNRLIMPKPAEPVKKSISKEEFEKLINSEKIVIVEFGAVWCGPCKMLKPVLDKISGIYSAKGVKIITIDVDDSKALSNEMMVNEIPLLLFYKNGKPMEQMIGFNPEAIIKETLEKYL
ncbi:MAG: thioredoxin domain-containing protein [Bacteroidia bacterium]